MGIFEFNKKLFCKYLRNSFFRYKYFGNNNKFFLELKKLKIKKFFFYTNLKYKIYFFIARFKNNH
jgi:hypothetical protein